MAKSKMIRVVDTPHERRSVALYRRVSTDKQRDDGYSLDVQKERLEAYALAMGGIESTKLYTDDGFTGASLERPGIQELISDAESGLITDVIVVKLDRISRSQKDTLHLIEDIFIPNNVAFISIQESFNTKTPFGRAMIGILSVFAQLERENIYERTRSGMQKRVEEGFWPGGGHPPFGYDYDKKKGILVPNKDAEKVRYAFERYLAGDSVFTIAKDLGFTYEKSVSDMIRRRTYLGFINYNGVEYKGRHKPIISSETFERTNQMLDDRGRRKLCSKTEYLLTGLIFCGQCGARMRYQKWTGDRAKLVCYSKQSSHLCMVKDENCDAKTYWADEFEEQLVGMLFDMAGEVDTSSTGNCQNMERINALSERLKDEQKTLKRLYKLYGSNGDDMLLSTIDDTKNNIQSIENEIEMEKLTMVQVDLPTNPVGNMAGLRDTWQLMTVKEKRVIIEEIVESIVIHNDFTELHTRKSTSNETGV